MRWLALLLVVMLGLVSCGGATPTLQPVATPTAAPAPPPTPTPSPTLAPTPTATPAPTPRPTPAPTPTPTPTPTPAPTATPTPSPTPIPTPTPTPTPQALPNLVEAAFAPVMDKVVVVFAHGSEGLQSFQGPSTQALSTLEMGKGYWVYAPSATTLSTTDFEHSLYPGWNMIAWVSVDTPVGTVMSAHSNDIYFVLGFDATQQKWSGYQSSLATGLMELQKGATYHSFMDTTGSTVSLPMGDKTLTLSQFGSWKWDP